MRGKESELARRRGKGGGGRDKRHGPPKRRPRPGRREREGKGPRAPRQDLAEARDRTARALADWLATPPKPSSGPEPFKLDPWQEEAFQLLREGASVVVDAPTTAGKTRVVEAFFQQMVNEPGFRAAYTTPVKSLSNDKLREFREMFGADKVGIATGDIKENLGAPIVVATLESYRNSLLGVEPDLGRQLVVFDEYHYLQDDARGSAWEEAIILTPPRCQVLLLSASVANAEQFAEWVESLGEGRRCVLVRAGKRPVPLVDLIHYGGSWILKDELPPQALKQLDRQLLEMPLNPERLVQKLTTLVDLGLTPTIVYAGRRLSTEILAQMLSRSLPPLPEDARVAIGESLKKSHEECQALRFIPQPLRYMLQTQGVGYHHSGLAAPARIAVESLVKQGLLRFCCATMGLSLGINFAVRSAVISDYRRPGEGGFTDYTPSEVLQMLGRAGRRGRDPVGFSLWATPEAYKKLGGAEREETTSRLRNDPTTFLGLVGRGFDLRQIEQFYAKSFRRFQDKGVDLSLITPWRVRKKVNAAELPCASPAAEATRYWWETEPSLCPECPYKVPCHRLQKAKLQSPLAALHQHLHGIGALTKDEKLTPFGNVARYFPQAGGLLLARMIAEGEVKPEKMLEFAELAATLALARFKEPGVPDGYRPPFDVDEIEEELEWYYPVELFEELYDPPFGHRDYPQLRELNGKAGYLIRQWAGGGQWGELIAEVTTEKYGTGDVMSLIYRVATYLQSVTQMGSEVDASLPGQPLGELRESAREVRDILLREPLSFALTI